MFQFVGYSQRTLQHDEQNTADDVCEDECNDNVSRVTEQSRRSNLQEHCGYSRKFFFCTRHACRNGSLTHREQEDDQPRPIRDLRWCPIKLVRFQRVAKSLLSSISNYPLQNADCIVADLMPVRHCITSYQQVVHVP